MLWFPRPCIESILEEPEFLCVLSTGLGCHKQPGIAVLFYQYCMAFFSPSCEFDVEYEPVAVAIISGDKGRISNLAGIG